jgi:hypothetical protein
MCTLKSRRWRTDILGAECDVAGHAEVDRQRRNGLHGSGKAMAAFLILATVLAVSGVVSVAMAWGVLGGVLYFMQLRARR